MIKVTVDDFVKRFKELGLTPVRQSWGIGLEKGVIVPKDNCACALGAMVVGENLAEHLDYEDELDANGAVTWASAWASEQGINTRDFLNGYDWIINDEEFVEDQASFDLGVAVRKALFPNEDQK